MRTEDIKPSLVYWENMNTSNTTNNKKDVPAVDNNNSICRDGKIYGMEGTLPPNSNSTGATIIKKSNDTKNENNHTASLLVPAVIFSVLFLSCLLFMVIAMYFPYHIHTNNISKSFLF